MLYVELNGRTEILPRQQLKISDVAKVCGEDAPGVINLPVPCPQDEGVWKLSAMMILNVIYPKCSDVSMMGAEACFVHVVPENKRNKTHMLRAVFAFLLLMLGSALAITWFHADVNMLDAQQDFFKMITGHKAENTWLITIPYALGVGGGVGLYYALIGRRQAVSPLDIQLDEYRESAEQVAGKEP